ncbi:MAG: NAD(P)H-dependent oxidoreductase [Candidatus Omnitrophica bacterium]|nr:NAD(P)H-dependent oxidoreductase [Candidatus Omnitrophota bacterium]
MKKIAIVFHSLSGNSYSVAKSFEEAFKALGQEVGLYRVPDPAWVMKPDVPEASRKLLEAMLLVPLARPEVLLDADMILMGSPTYFGNVSSPMKAFMDQTGGLWFQGKLVGKKFAAFTSAGNTEGGADLCLQALGIYAQYMGMICFPMPVNILPGKDVNALGVIHYSAGKYSTGLDKKVLDQINNFSKWVVSILNGA